MAKARGGPAKKAPGTAIKSTNGVRIILKEPGERTDPPAHITHQLALSAWEDFWQDPVSSLVKATDQPLLARWVDLTQRYWAIVDELEATSLTSCDDKFKLSAHPLLQAMNGIEQAIERLEAKFGMGPKNRAALGIAIVGLEKAERNLPAAAPQVPDEPDPRLS